MLTSKKKRVHLSHEKYLGHNSHIQIIGSNFLVILAYYAFMLRRRDVGQ